MSEISSLAALTSSLYGGDPKVNLYHYTSLDGIVGIRECQGIWATKIQYFSDQSELEYAFDLFRHACWSIKSHASNDRSIAEELYSWLGHSTHVAEASIFVACFSEKRDSLSQWRGYTPMGRGACLELERDHVVECANQQGFELCECIYDRKRQHDIAQEAVNLMVADARKIGVNRSRTQRSYSDAFADLLDNLIRVAATFKHRAFEDEKEWRLILKLDHRQPSHAVAYRSGRHTLIPFVTFSLQRPTADRFRIENVWVGPSPNIDLTVAAMKSLFAGQIKCGRYPVMKSEAPYRET